MNEQWMKRYVTIAAALAAALGVAVSTGSSAAEKPARQAPANPETLKPKGRIRLLLKSCIEDLLRRRFPFRRAEAVKILGLTGGAKERQKHECELHGITLYR